MAIHAAMLLSLVGSLALAAILLSWTGRGTGRGAGRVAGARLLTLFLLGTSVWIVGNELPTFAGPGAARIALALMATASVTSAVFFHFALAFTGTVIPRRWLQSAYALGGAATLLSTVFVSGHFAPFADVALMAMPNAVGLVTTVVWAVLAVAGHLVLLRALLRLRGLPQRQVAGVMASSAWGVMCMTGYGIAAFELPFYPWPLLALPVYPVILVYAILRYRALVANAWARRGLAWTLLVLLAAAVVALLPLLPIGDVPGQRWVSAALVATACLVLNGPARRLASRMVYPGGTISQADLARWREDLAQAASTADLAQRAAALLSQRLKIPVVITVADETAAMPPSGFGQETAPHLACTPGPEGWHTVLLGWDAAPPGPIRVAEVLAALLTEEATRLDRAKLLAETERERQVQARLAELGELATTVAHDVRNPLNIISMAIVDAPPDVRTEVGAQIRRISRLAEDLLDYAKPWQLRRMEFDLSDHVRRIALRYPAAEIGPGLLHAVPVTADPYRLEQALLNLLDNAAAAGSRILLDAQAGNTGVQVDVCDNGPGVPADLRQRLFQPFVSRSPGGTGLGLAIVARIMGAHGGSVMLANRAGWATCFRLSLPAPQPVIPALL